jgi:hypothetical protein
MKQKIVLKDKKPLEKKNMKTLIMQVVLMKIVNKKISLQQFLSLSESEIQGLLHPAQLGYFLAWFQSLQLPSTQSDSPLAPIPLAAKSHVSYKVCTQLSTEFFISHISIRIIRHTD